MRESEAIAAVLAAARAGPSEGVRLGIGDDAAVLDLAGADRLVACADTLNLGTHFAAGHPPRDLGHKALAVNLSDLAAMGAEPRWALLSLSAPELEPPWLEAFLAGFMALAREHRVALVGGDTTRGPLSLAVTALGVGNPRGDLRRGAAAAGDRLWVSGALGDASLALAGDGGAAARRRLLAPVPRVALGRRLPGLASACIDLSDGLRADLPRLLGPRLGGVVHGDRLPVSAALAARLAGDPSAWRHALVGGDDYELLFTAPAGAEGELRAVAAAAGTPVSAIGEVDSGPGIRYRDAAGRALDVDALPGFEHFS